MLKKIAITVVALSLNSLAQAQPGTAMPAYMPTPDRFGPRVVADFSADSPAGILQQGMGDLLKYLGGSQGKPQQLEQYVNEKVAGHFDFAYMAKAAAGSMYRYMSEEQRKQMSDQIKKEFLSTMVQRLGSYNNQQVRIMSQHYSADGRTATVTAGIIGPRGYPTRLDFRFYKSNEGWKVFDVMANGQSAVVHYRRQFRQSMMAMPRGRSFQPLLPRRPYGVVPGR